jgi:decaprenyl-phosphate phosphoribosyltransferase
MDMPRSDEAGSVVDDYCGTGPADGTSLPSPVCTTGDETRAARRGPVAALQRSAVRAMSMIGAVVPRQDMFTSQVRLLVRAARPRHMVKNSLVLTPPFAAGQLLEPRVFGCAMLAAIAFSAAAAGVYLLNDVIDASADRAHPTKRLRPVAAGLLRPRRAIAASVVLLAVAVLVCFPASAGLAVVVAVYVQLQLVYCFWLRRQPVLDICVVAAGFVLRVVAGAVATGVTLSPWLLLATAFGSLFMVSGRRYAEANVPDHDGRTSRATLDRYSASYLRFVWSSSATMSILTYMLWSVYGPLRAGPVGGGLAAALFVIAVLRYALEVDSGDAGAPEDIAFSDKRLQALALLWLVTMTVAVYA